MFEQKWSMFILRIKDELLNNLKVDRVSNISVCSKNILFASRANNCVPDYLFNFRIDSPWVHN